MWSVLSLFDGNGFDTSLGGGVGLEGVAISGTELKLPCSGCIGSVGADGTPLCFDALKGREGEGRGMTVGGGALSVPGLLGCAGSTGIRRLLASEILPGGGEGLETIVLCGIVPDMPSGDGTGKMSPDELLVGFNVPLGGGEEPGKVLEEVLAGRGP